MPLCAEGLRHECAFVRLLGPTPALLHCIGQIAPRLPRLREPSPPADGTSRGGHHADAD
ncbi:protein of unknown function [Ralstonia solanacearum CFBP2957]|nr:protein of unknown function [Ralstonia solanacearum CFBP2957]